MIRDIEIHKNGINANNRVRTYEVHHRDNNTRKVTVLGIFSGLEEALYFCERKGFDKNRLQFNF